MVANAAQIQVQKALAATDATEGAQMAIFRFTMQTTDLITGNLKK